MLGEEEMDNAVLGRLCQSGPWAPAELERELGLGAGDAVDRLVANGLAHRLGGDFVIASASGRHAHNIDPTWR
jgi:hypothetical protein